ncbi:MAG: putative DNA binding domain-containing protein, partial [Pseudonocardia sp.]|nr:putative DNA binding domain-containing protein [Pseudonocardia sp.]
VEPSDVEVKSAAGGLPTSVVETISAFANGSGGTLLLGVDERAGFAPAAGFDAPAVRDALADACANKLEPPCRAPIEIEDVGGALIVRLDVPESDPVEKPCFVTSRGAYGGAFIRGGDGDRHLSHYEVTQLLSNRGQPRFDREPVAGATEAHLDQRLIAACLERVRRRSPAFHDTDRELLLIRLGVLVPDADGVLRPTLAGLLCFGEYPQEFFPQLFVSFVVLPGLRMGEKAPDGRRFLDNATIVGPISTMVDDVITVAVRNMRAGAIIQDAGREDRYDYPLDVIRELVVNALMHRDYSPDARGTQVQVELYPDRLVVMNAGGLFGPISVGALGSEEHPTTSRNQALAALLADIELPGFTGRAVCENRGSGLLGVLSELRRVGMSPPQFDAAPARVIVTVPQDALLAPETVAWIGTLGHTDLSEEQHLAVAMMRAAGRVTNAMLQAWGVDRLTAGRTLKNLVDRGIAVRNGRRRYASYSLVEELLLGIGGSVEPADGSSGVGPDLNTVLQAIRAGDITSQALSRSLGLPKRTVVRRLNALIERGLIESTQPRQSNRQSYRLVDPKENR